MLRRLLKDEDGQSLVEYGLILGLISVGLIAVLGSMNKELQRIFDVIVKDFKSVQAVIKATR